jgi:hypothetical protein
MSMPWPSQHTHLLPRYSIHIVSSCFIPFILGRGGNVCLHDDQKTTGYCLTEYSCIVQLSYIAHLPQIHPLFNFASSSIVQLFYISHLPQIHPLFNFASSSIVQLSYIAHLPQIYPFFNFASSSIVQLP